MSSRIQRLKDKGHFFERSVGSSPEKTRVLRKSRPLPINEQIKQMMRYEKYEEERLDEDFIKDDVESDVQSPHELVFDEETGLEMCRYEKELLDLRRPTFDRQAKEKAAQDYAKFVAEKAAKRGKADPGAKRGKRRSTSVSASDKDESEDSDE